ncbi:hypothetical protein J3R83DRAFT_5002 [Lanmaoa asiatica]|nr:hypothetical protein J3R83DRAFT_5002 [Lanmaoa asiatica]
MPGQITRFETHDIRFPTSLTGATPSGEDSTEVLTASHRNTDCDYSAAYVTLYTDYGLEGHGMTFTIGRGTDIVCHAIQVLSQRLIGRDPEEFFANMGQAWDWMSGDPQLRWIGPEKGIIHLALAAVNNAVWDMFSRSRKKPLWKLIVDMTPEELVSATAFRYITDVLTREEALAMLKAREGEKQEREAYVKEVGYVQAPLNQWLISDNMRARYPAYITSAGWLGYPDEKVAHLTKEAVQAGWTHFKMKVGASLEDDLRRGRMIRRIIDDPKNYPVDKPLRNPDSPELKGRNAGPTGAVLMIDANQVWDCQRGYQIRERTRRDPTMVFIEEPTAPDDILGHAAIRQALAPYGIGVATGEHAHNRMTFKQLFQAEAVDVAQIDACRLGGVSEVLGVLLMAAKFGVLVCPHAGGVGLCEHVIHLSLIDYIAISGSMERNVIEYANHLHEHFVYPCSINEQGRYVVPESEKEGYSTEMHTASIAEYEFPNGTYWKQQDRLARTGRTMAYDDQRTFARPALQSVMHAEHDGRRIYGREQSVGFQYMNQPPFVQGGLVSSPPSRGYAPTGPIHMAGPSRRPLPTPRTRPESMPPPLRQSPLVLQAPAPSRPAILAPSATLATSPTAPPARRPLPTPALAPARPSTKHTSIDLTTRPISPVKSIIGAINANHDHDLRIPSSFSRRTAPPPDASNRPPSTPAAPFSTPPPTWPRSPRSDSHETQEIKLAPFWNRNLPTTTSTSIGTNVIERRSTVSGIFPPTVTVPTPRPDNRRVENPARAQPAQRLQSSPSRRPLPSSPTETPRVPSLHQHVPASSEDEHDISSPSDISSLSDRDAYEPMTFADPMQTEDDEHDIGFARSARIPSPQYGIRDLPTRSRIAIAHRDDRQNADTIVSGTQQEQTTRLRPVRSATLPPPPTPSSSTPQSQPRTTSLPQSPRAPPVSSPFTQLSGRSPPPGTPTAEPRSLTLRFASMGLAEERERERQGQTQQEASSPPPAQSPNRAATGPTSPVRQQQGWHANVAPLPRAPGNTTRPFFGTTDTLGEFVLPNIRINVSCVPFSPSSAESAIQAKRDVFTIFSIVADESDTPSPPLLIISEYQRRVPQLSERQLQKQRVRDDDIDLDDAPPPSLRRSPSPIRQGFNRTPAIEITNDTPPRRQWTPGQGVTSRTGNVSANGMNNPYHAGSQSLERTGQAVTQPQQAAVPRISLPDGHHDNDSDVDDAFGPSIVVSRPGSGPGVSVSAPDPSAISISEAPSITVLEHGAPAISMSTVDSPSLAFSPPKISVSDLAHPQRSGPSPGSFGSRHTQIQESSVSRSMPSRGPGSKRGLPPPPSSSSPMRTNGLSCGGCNGPIIGRIVSAMGQRWHPNCFKCTICNELLEHDYHETFAPRCFHCKTAIIDERFITLDDPALGKRTYHEQHFFCAECGDPFLAPTGPLQPSVTRTGELNLAGDGEFVDDDVGFTVYRGHPYCETCHVRLRMPKCKACKKSIRDGVRAVEALGGKWCWGCFVCEFDIEERSVKAVPMSVKTTLRID